jgi:hypothetical protein
MTEICFKCNKPTKKIVYCETCWENEGFENRKLIRIALLKRLKKEIQKEIKSEQW